MMLFTRILMCLVVLMVAALLYAVFFLGEEGGYDTGEVRHPQEIGRAEAL
jgi:hypothetical protein